jgi:hypothetical protein
MLQVWIDAFGLRNKVINPSIYTPQGQIASSQAAIINDKNIDILNLVNACDVDKAQGIFLDCLLKILGIRRISAQPTVVVVYCYGFPGTLINGKETANPAKVQDNVGNIYICQSSAAIGLNGVGIIAFENEQGGAIPCLANTVKTIITTVPGWDAVDNLQDGSLGIDAESDEAFRLRYKELFDSSSFGTVGAMQNAILLLDGVLDCVGAENNTSNTVSFKGYEMAPNSYVMSVLGGNDAEIAMNIFLKKSLGAQNGNTTVEIRDPANDIPYMMRFLRPAPLDYFFNVSIENSANLPGEIEGLIKDAVYENFYNPRVRIASTIYASRFTAAVSTALPYVNIASLTVATQPQGGVKTPYNNIANCNADQYPQLDKSNIAVFLG